MWVDSLHLQLDVIERAAQVVREGGVVLYPSDTIYGIGCDPFCLSAVRHIFEVKKRPSGKGFLVLVPGLEWLEGLACELNSMIFETCTRFWPAPLTVVLKARPELSPELTGSEGKIGVRWPNSPFLQAWMEHIPGPLVSTSANLAGGDPVTSISELERLFGSKVDLFLKTNKPLSETASTVIDLSTTPPKLLRSGPLGEEVKRYIADRFAGQRKFR